MGDIAGVLADLWENRSGISAVVWIFEVEILKMSSCAESLFIRYIFKKINRLGSDWVYRSVFEGYFGRIKSFSNSTDTKFQVY